MGTNRGYQFQDSILIIIIRGRVPQLWHTPRGSLLDDVAVMSWTKTWLGADSDLLFWKLNSEGKSKEKAGMSAGLRERERERGGRFVIKKRERKESRRREREQAKQRRKSRVWSDSSFNKPFRFWGFLWKKGIHPCLHTSFPYPWAGAFKTSWTDWRWIFFVQTNNYITIILFYSVMEVTITMYLIKSNGGYIF